MKTFAHMFWSLSADNPRTPLSISGWTGDCNLLGRLAFHSCPAFRQESSPTHKITLDAQAQVLLFYWADSQVWEWCRPCKGTTPFKRGASPLHHSHFYLV